MLSLSQKQALHQRLSPQQVQYLKMLQLPVIALEQRIKQELEVNPLLEELSDVVQETEQEFEPEPTLSVTERDSKEDDEKRKEEEKKEERENEFEWEDFVNSEYEGYKAPSFTGPDTEEQDEIPQRSEESLFDLLLSQLRLQLLSEDELALAEEIIGNIDDHGYLRRELSEIVEDLNKFIATTIRARAAAAEEALLGDGHFDAYEEVVGDEPFGRERLRNMQSATATVSDDDLPLDPFAVSLDDDDLAAADGATATASAPAAQPLSLQDMSKMSIEELARLLEQGTSAVLPSNGNGNGNGSHRNGTSDGVATRVAEEVPEIFSLTEAESVLHRIQRLDPPGIGARDLQECLSIQLELMADESPEALLAGRVVNEAYHEFAMKHFEKVCHRLDCTTDELKGAIDVIRSLNPKPGAGSSGLIEDNYLTPDFVIERDGLEFLIIPNDRHIPTLRINRAYQELMRRGKGKRKDVDRDTRKFLRDKFEAAKWFIASIQQRRQTMMKVMRAIVDLQMDFFLHGPDFIKPMIYKDVAERIGMDISTVCRVVNGKYSQTDYGTFELRYFFSEKLETTSGEEVSTKIVKARIEELIAAEDKSRPLSDDAISKEMEKAGYQVARRTVAKYREQMNIPVARLRRSL